MTARITVAICTYQRYRILPRAIDSVLRQGLDPGDFRVLVIDNSGDPERARDAARQYTEVDHLAYVTEARPGVSNARNAAMERCQTELLAFLDDDAVATPDWLGRILGAFDASGEDVVAVGGRVLPVWQAARPAWLHDDALGYLSVVDWGGGRREPGPAEWLATTNLAFRVQALVAAGGFSARLGRSGSSILLSNEDLEMVRRLRAAGGRVIYEPAAVVLHLVGRERLDPAWFRKRVAWQAVSDYIMEPDAALAKARAAWPRVRRFLRSGSRGPESLRALAEKTDDPNRFMEQLHANYLLTLMLLAGSLQPVERRRARP